MQLTIKCDTLKLVGDSPKTKRLAVSPRIESKVHFYFKGNAVVRLWQGQAAAQLPHDHLDEIRRSV